MDSKILQSSMINENFNDDGSPWVSYFFEKKHYQSQLDVVGKNVNRTHLPVNVLNFENAAGEVIDGDKEKADDMKIFITDQTERNNEYQSRINTAGFVPITSQDSELHKNVNMPLFKLSKFPPDIVQLNTNISQNSTAARNPGTLGSQTRTFRSGDNSNSGRPLMESLYSERIENCKTQATYIDASDNEQHEAIKSKALLAISHHIKNKILLPVVSGKIDTTNSEFQRFKN